METKFDKKLDFSRDQIPPELEGSLIVIADTFDFCRAIAEDVCGEKATPEIALQLMDRVLAGMYKYPKLLNSRKNELRK